MAKESGLTGPQSEPDGRRQPAQPATPGSSMPLFADAAKLANRLVSDETLPGRECTIEYAARNPRR